MSSTDKVGIYGEMVAAEWLVCNGYSVLRRNWRMDGSGEIDLVCRDGEELVFIEVKTRRKSTPYTGTPARAVNRQKRELIRRGARRWLSMLGGMPVSWRYDVAEVLLVSGQRPQVFIIKSAFGEKE